MRTGPTTARGPDKLAHLRPLDAPSLSMLMSGKVHGEVWTNGHMLVIELQDGHCIEVAWVNNEGKPVDGRPAINFAGKKVRPRVGGVFQRDLVTGR